MANLKVFNNSLQRLTHKKDYFSGFNGIEDWIFREDEAVVNRESEYLLQIKEHVLRRYRSRDTYVSPAALDHIIFHAVSTCEAADAERAIHTAIAENGLNRTSVVVFPLHSFGFTYLGARVLVKGIRDLHFEYDNFRLVPQSNSFPATKRAILDYVDAICLPNRAKLDAQLFDHFRRSRDLKWMERNPLMMIHFRFSQYENWDNVLYILEKLAFVTTKLYFIQALSPVDPEDGRYFSTRNTNNFETLDIRHFLTISTRRGGIAVNCLPVYVRRPWVFDYVHMNATISIKGKPDEPWFDDALRAIDTVHRGFVAFQLQQQKADLKYYRLASALKYFRRSVKAVAAEDRVINLNTAFEIMLLDHREMAKRHNILERTWRLFRSRTSLRRKIIRERLGALINERNSIIHDGAPPAAELDYRFLFRLFCRLFLFMVDDLRRIDSTKPGYVSTYFDGIG